MKRSLKQHISKVVGFYLTYLYRSFGK